ncbi:uncharacterized protein LOC141651126 [Silene latifolia]|uniref:uncharacterized protein LOC141651126 n=1 Tax=Silene latifolia TaxID=37657 RepID=UPI003D779826
MVVAKGGVGPVYGGVGLLFGVGQAVRKKGVEGGSCDGGSGTTERRCSDDTILKLSKLETAKDIWDALKTKYGKDDFGTKKYACIRWLNFRITDEKPVLDQVHEYETLCADIIAEGMKICETFQANCLLEKLPLSWQNYVHSMKHKQKNFTLLELVSHIKIEEQNRIQLRGKQVDHSSSNANLVETKNRNKGLRHNNNNNHNNKRPNQIHRVKKQTNFKPKRPFKGECFTCGETGHSAKYCPQGSQEK